MHRLRCGVGKTWITPALPFYLAGHKHPRRARRIGDHLAARALVIGSADRRTCIISCDLLWLGREHVALLKQRVAELTDIKEQEVFICCTHTHSGPDLLEWYGAPYDLPVTSVEATLAQVCSAAVLACQETQECLVDRFDMPLNIGVSRRRRGLDSVERHPNPAALIDRGLNVIRFCTSSGDPIAAIVHHGTHPVVLGGDSETVSGDWCGIACQEVEQALDTTVLFLGGAFGDVNPITWTGGTYSDVKRLGKAVAAACKFLLLSPFRPELAGPNDIVSLRKEIMVQGSPHPYLKTYQAKRSDSAGNITTEVNLFRIGGTVLLGLPGECTAGLADQFRSGELSAQTLVISCVNDYVGYLPTLEQLSEGGYEAKATMISPSGLAAIYGIANGLLEDAESLY